MEFKAQVSPKNLAELAKDVAMLANMYGGTIVVGGRETAGGIEYSALPAEYARELQVAYGNAVRDFCSPQPIFVTYEIANPDSPESVVVIVAVEPYPDQPVGAATASGNGEPTQGWRFPIRVESHAVFLPPEQLMLWINPKTRRAAIAISQIQVGEKVHFFCDAGSKTNLQPYEDDATLGAWSALENYVELNPTRGHVRRFRAPLEDVASVWKSDDNTWCMRLRGQIVPIGSSARYHPNG